MDTYISFLRGINVSGHNIIKMTTLKNMYENLGFQQIKTYLQSGNVVFQAQNTSTEILELIIKNAMVSNLNLNIPILIYTLDQLIAIIKNDPFTTEKDIDYSFVYVTLLNQNCSSSDLQLLTDKLQEDEKVIVKNKLIYLYAPRGYSKTKLTNNYIENKLRTFATTRNWKTITELNKIAGNY